MPQKVRVHLPTRRRTVDLVLGFPAVRFEPGDPRCLKIEAVLRAAGAAWDWTAEMWWLPPTALQAVRRLEALGFKLSPATRRFLAVAESQP